MRILTECYRRMSVGKRLEMVVQLNRELEMLATSRVRAKYGEVSDRELSLRLGALRIGREEMARVFGWDPEERGY